MNRWVFKGVNRFNGMMKVLVWDIVIFSYFEYYVFKFCKYIYFLICGLEEKVE